MTKLELEKIANLDTNCTSCNQSNSLMEAARRDTKFKFEFEVEVIFVITVVFVITKI